MNIVLFFLYMLIFWINVMKVFINLLLLVLLTSCISYGTYSNYGGYAKAIRMSDDVWKVSYVLVRGDSMEDARNYVLLKAATVALDHGFQYFIVKQSNVDVSHSSFTMPTRVVTNSQGNANAQVSPYSSSVSANSNSRSDTIIYGGDTINLTRKEIIAYITPVKDKKTVTDSSIMVYGAPYLLDSISDLYRFDKHPYVPPQKTHYRFHRDGDRSNTIGLKQLEN